MMENYPAFEQAVEEFRSFLKSEDLPEEIAWVNPDDAVLINKRIVIRMPDANIARSRALSDYLRGCRRGLGVELGVLCQINVSVCCFVYMPQDEDEAARHLMPNGLKLTHPVPVPNALIVTNCLEWLLAKWLSRRWHSQVVLLFHQE